MKTHDSQHAASPSSPHRGSHVPGGSRTASPSSGHKPGTHHIEMKLHDMDQLFNTMDPSPFHERDLDDDAAEFILSWAQEYQRPEPVDLIIHLENMPEGGNAQQLVENAVHHFFIYRARLNALEFRRLMKQGRMSLFVGVSFLVVCFLLIGLIPVNSDAIVPNFFKEGLTIAGWVAMWRPLQIYLYEWWPLRRRGQILYKLSRMSVEVRKRG